ncbi:MAG: hypothetical protein ACI9TH_001101, partial [Kiritimatiellia bacterium]
MAATAGSSSLVLLTSLDGFPYLHVYAITSTKMASLASIPA